MAGHKVAILTDTHFGVRKGNQIFHDYFEKFYTDIFFPTLDERGITTVIHLGDAFDVRKGIDYWSLDWAKRVFFDELHRRGIELHLIVGNHDIFYKESLAINSPGLNLREYDNISIYSRPETVTIKDRLCFMVPWICNDNAEQFMEQLESTSSTLCMGHLELAGFYANKDYQCQHGTDANIFSKFDTVFSGHFHKKSTRGNVTYLGNTYQLYWNDEGETRGFHIFDMKTNELEFIENTNNMFNKLYYNEKEKKLINHHKFGGTYVKIIVEEKSTPARLSQLVDNLYSAGVHDVKIIEKMDLGIDVEEEIEAEDTLTTLTNYVNAMEVDLNKENVIGIFKSLYVEAQEV